MGTKVFASEDLKRVLVVDSEDFTILDSFGLDNVLCCEGESLIETEELKEVEGAEGISNYFVSEHLGFKDYFDSFEDLKNYYECDEAEDLMDVQDYLEREAGGMNYPIIKEKVVII